MLSYELGMLVSLPPISQNPEFVISRMLEASTATYVSLNSSPFYFEPPDVCSFSITWSILKLAGF
jgi:hypothetical protein